MMLRFQFGRRVEMVKRVCLACEQRRAALRGAGTRTWQPAEARCARCAGRTAADVSGTALSAGNPAPPAALASKRAAFA